MSTRLPNPNFKIHYYKLSLQGFGTKADTAANLTDHKAFTVSVSAFIHYQSVGEGCSPLGRRHEVTEGEASPPRNAPPENLSVQGHPTAEQITFSVGYGACDVPQLFRTISLKCGTNTCFRRDLPQPETAPLCRYATPPLRGDHIGHPQNDGRIRYRKT